MADPVKPRVMPQPGQRPCCVSPAEPARPRVTLRPSVCFAFPTSRFQRMHSCTTLTRRQAGTG
eukprot:scaffold157839_cov23-Tisochrysis_lutea.AAC.1